VYYLSYLYKRFGNWDTALAGYNAGHGRVSDWLTDTRYSDDGITLKAIPYPETEQYVKKINKVKLIYVDLYCENSQFTD
jgi:soluble lytic murein transglycosylase